VHEFVQKCFQPDISTFSHFRQWAHYFLVIFSKVDKFVQNSDFRAWSARFVISARGHHFSIVCSKVHEFVQNTSFQPEISTFWHFPTEHTHFLKGYTTFKRFSAKCTSLYQKEVFSPRSTRFVIFSLGTPLFNAFQESARVCTKQEIQPEIRKFCHFRTRRTTF